MANQFVNKPDPWGEESSFEKMTAKAGTAVTQAVKKAATQTATDVVGDIKEQIVGGGKPSSDDVKSNKDPQATAMKQQQSQEEQHKLLNQTRQNLEKLNAEIKKAREERIKKYEERNRSETQEKQKKEVKLEEKKKEESALMKMIKGKQGSREGVQRAGG